ncbi:MAG: dihydrolipoamide acetyltransferase family protein [Actinomycetota bacterium]|nr:dihydrolipoamide acetyltransferase family protein [Actinomycetota bacterium]
MSVFGVKLPDVGEGVAEAELISWHVGVGDTVTTQSVLAEVMTDKATVEISAPVAGVIAFLHGEPGDTLAVGGEFVGIETGGDAPAPPTVATAPPPVPAPGGPRPTAAPAVRARAKALGIDLAGIAGSGPDGRVVHADLDRLLTGGHSRPAATRTAGAEAPHTEPVRGLRRRIAEHLTSAWTEIPHITYVDAVDATELERLRAQLNERGHTSGVRLTMLPFVMRAIVIACGEQPRLNAHFDATTRTVSLFDGVHVGIATQTPDGLMVPVVHHAEARGLWGLAEEINRVATAAREGTATLQELGGSTITITSLGALGGLVTTPIINQPEVAIVGVNKLETRPVWADGAFQPRLMCNLSSSFDHRIVDGWDAAVFVQRIKALLETPALLFIDE